MVKPTLYRKHIFYSIEQNVFGVTIWHILCLCYAHYLHKINYLQAKFEDQVSLHLPVIKALDFIIHIREVHKKNFLRAFSQFLCTALVFV